MFKVFIVYLLDQIESLLFFFKYLCYCVYKILDFVYNLCIQRLDRCVLTHLRGKSLALNAFDFASNAGCLSLKLIILHFSKTCLWIFFDATGVILIAQWIARVLKSILNSSLYVFISIIHCSFSSAFKIFFFCGTTVCCSKSIKLNSSSI